MGEKISVKDIAGETLTFNDFSDFDIFFKEESKFWETQKKNIGQPAGANFLNISSNILPLITAHNEAAAALKESPEDKNLKQNAERSKQNAINWVNAHWLYSATPFSHKLIETYKKSHKIGNVFKDAILKKTLPPMANAVPLDSFSGAILAYEYLFQDESQITKRRSAEKSSFAQLRKRLEQESADLSGAMSEIKSSFLEWDEATRADFYDWFDQKKEEHVNFISNLEEEKEKSLHDYNLFFTGMAETGRKKIDELELLYREQLRLEKPAEYWRKRAVSLSFQGGIWATLLGISSLIAIIFSGVFFYFWLSRDPVAIGLHSIQGAALFGTTVAAVGYLIRTLAKLTFSSYHLQRDAEEREQLSYFYLALIKEGAVEESSRDIILQSLFSRSESGLLTGDSGPSMPSPSDILKSTSRFSSKQ